MSMHAVFALGRSAALLTMLAFVDALADEPDPLLLEGERGTGKTVLARHIHERSGLRGDFIVRPIPAIPDSLQQSVLFGHVRGAFTGATGDHRGLVESAQGGTLFLDELGEATEAVQASLLEVLESGTVTRLGEARSRPVSVRILAATNADLSERTTTGRFRRDLLDRFGPFRIRIPPLRERKDEIIPLFLSFLPSRSADHQLSAGTTNWTLGAGVESLLLAVPWHGNLRQLRKEARFAAAFAGEGRVIGHEHLSPDLQAEGDVAAGLCTPAVARRRARARFEGRAVMIAEQRNIAATAARLQVSERRVFQILATPCTSGKPPRIGRPRREK